MKHAALAIVLLALPACTGQQAPAPPKPGGLPDLLARTAGARICASLTGSEREAAARIIPKAQVATDAALYQQATSGDLMLIGTLYDATWGLVHSQIDPTSADAAAWTTAAQRLIRLSVDGCAAGLGLHAVAGIEVNDPLTPMAISIRLGVLSGDSHRG